MVFNKKISNIYAVTPNTFLNSALIKRVIIEHQISILQYRHKINDDNIKLKEAYALRLLCLEYNTLFIINDDINLAEKIHADGVHLGKDDDSIQQARQQLGDAAIIGMSCYDNIDLALQAQNQGASYVAFGALFDSNTKPNAPYCPFSLITKVKKILNIPIVGIGGIDLHNQQQAFDAGCDAVAMINTLFKKHH
ncbi:thiamine-phosphate diphosphorylase [Candidatus Ruthia magnifica str. Cm (Calyptogena magnifica)]|uniref:Thiamine-phosphate synthase n=1 Tax=Ruthia magnifica subsp. Calyptogena magnifica TaxID=413404 RepID=A1AVC4_RUTMC|nr:thiamine phosphate synthase [Candidatus Ruthturnera calyptogenae]ABL01881.1 thiamine-phosphate diphosphorylase [Candidatus Ruthia magnifica str. Cm (Calyptogena magnifica)]